MSRHGPTLDIQTNSVTVISVALSASTGFEGWITSDGRVYLVYLTEVESGPPVLPESSEREPERLAVNKQYIGLKSFF